METGGYSEVNLCFTFSVSYLCVYITIDYISSFSTENQEWEPKDWRVREKIHEGFSQVSEIILRGWVGHSPFS